MFGCTSVKPAETSTLPGHEINILDVIYLVREPDVGMFVALGFPQCTHTPITQAGNVCLTYLCRSRILHNSLYALLSACRP
jgi:hypothetical protein